ncbi:Gfo/Idh/MocA family oxidoreductase [Streptomyces canus]|uniref:Gfo/Idh/MocA family protein n=1 Tax=Streptomyces canus TaxID=58343 RepID=UPI0030DFEB5A
MTTDLRVGLVGFGWVNREVWFPRLLQHRNCQVVAVCDPAFTGQRPDPLDGVAVVDRPAALVEHDLDFAVVATPNHLHEEAAGHVLDAGVAALVEKPLCLSSAELKRLTRRAVAGGSTLQVSRVSARRRDVLALRSLVRRMSVGPVQVRAEWLRSAGVPRPGSWFTRRAEAGGGALLDLGWHLAEATAGMLPGSRPVELTAHLSGTSSEAVEAGAKWRADEGGTGPIDVETDGELRAVYPDGSSLSLRAAWVSDTPVDTTRISVRGTDAEGAPYRAELLTTFGFSPHRVTCPVLRVERAGQHHEWHAGTVPGQEYDDQLEAAVAMVRRRAPWRTELLGTASVMALFEEAYRVAGRPLLPEGEAEPVGVRRC